MRLSVVGAAFLLLASVGAAPAKKPLPTSTRMTVAEFAECVVRKRYASAVEVLKRNVPNSEILEDYRKLIDSDCLFEARNGSVATLSLPGDHMRYAIAGAVFDQSFAKAPPPNVAGLTPLEHLPLPDENLFRQELARAKSKKRRDELEKQFESSKVTAYLSRYGECVVRNDPANAKALLLSREGTVAESGAFASLRPVFAHCLPPNQTLRFSRIQLRGLVALNYARLALASAAGPA